MPILMLLLSAAFTVLAVDYQQMHGAMSRRFGAPGVAALVEWQKQMQTLAPEKESVRLRGVNDFFNQHVRFGEDSRIWGQSDYWATPLETLGKGAGDCEDFAIAKYFSLLVLGVPDEKLRLIYVQARLGGLNSSISQAHMVLAFYATPGVEPLILDNLIAEMHPASRRPDLVPVFSFNSQGLWQGLSGSGGPGGPASLSRWKELLIRSKAEGFDGIWFENPPKK